MMKIELKGAFLIWYLASCGLGTLTLIGALIWSMALGEGVAAVAFMVFIYAPLPLAVIIGSRTDLDNPAE
jgi:hypothetical protein